MSTKNIIALILVIVGVIVLASSGLSFESPGESVRLLGLRFQTTEHHFIPPWAGVVVVIAGIVLFLVPLPSAKKGA